MAVDERGRPRRFIVRPGHRGDAPVAAELIGNFAPDPCLADAACDANALRALLVERGTLPVMPNNPSRKHRHPFDRALYKLRDAVERTFAVSRTFAASRPGKTAWPTTTRPPSLSPLSSHTGYESKA
jgi:transposase